MRPTARVVIVNWNSDRQLADCVASIVASESQVPPVVVVDNGSTDDSVSTLQQSPAAAHAKVISLGRNVGFAAACNIGAEGAGEAYLLFLNPDATMHLESLSQAIAFMERPTSHDIGICGVRLVDDDGVVHRHCARLPSVRSAVGRITGTSRLLPRLFPPHFMVEFDHLSSREVDQVIGAFFLMRRDMFEALGGFDERFFVYYEEVDLSLRARQAGWRTWYLADVTAHHSGGGTSRKVKARRLFYSVRSQMLYGFKHFGVLQGFTLALLLLVAEPLARSARALARGSPSEMLDTWRGYAMLYADLPDILRIAARAGTAARATRTHP